MNTLFVVLAIASSPTAWSATTPSDAPSAHHDVALVDERLVIDSHWSTGAWVVEHPRAALALPLPAQTELEGAVAERDEHGLVVALVFDGRSAPRTRMSLPLALARAQGMLPIPVVQGSAVQRISLDAALAFHPDPALGMVTHLGHTVASELDHPQRRAIDHQLRAAPLGSYYATTAAITREHGLRGELELRADVRRRSAVGGAVIFVLACGAGLLGYRRVRRSAEAERAEQVLDAEFDALEVDRS